MDGKKVYYCLINIDLLEWIQWWSEETWRCYGSNMWRLAFECSKLSVYDCAYLLLLTSF